MDRETQQVLTEANKIIDFANSDGWKFVKAKFTEKIMDLQSIKNLSDIKTATALQKEISIRNEVVDILMEVIREVEEQASKALNNKPLLTQYEEETITVRY